MNIKEAAPFEMKAAQRPQGSDRLGTFNPGDEYSKYWHQLFDNSSGIGVSEDVAPAQQAVREPLSPLPTSRNSAKTIDSAAVHSSSSRLTGGGHKERGPGRLLPPGGQLERGDNPTQSVSMGAVASRSTPQKSLVSSSSQRQFLAGLLKDRESAPPAAVQVSILKNVSGELEIYLRSLMGVSISHALSAAAQALAAGDDLSISKVSLNGSCIFKKQGDVTVGEAESSSRLKSFRA
jgi:hypothetical protein